MASSQLCHCAICLSDLPMNLMRSLACGHCFCKVCLGQLQRANRRSCPECRHPIGVNDPQPIYLRLVDYQSPLERITSGIGRMDDTVPVKSVDGAIKKLKQVATQEREDSKLDDLLQAIEAFETRLKPAFLRMKSQETQISLLEAKQLEFDAIRAKADRVITLDGEVAMLRIDQTESRKQVNAANERWSQALELVKEREAENLRLRRDVEAKEQKSMDEVRRLKGYLERNYAVRNQLAARIKDLEQERNALLEQHSTNLSTIDSIVDLDTDDENGSRRAVFSPHRSSTSTVRAPKRATLDFEGVPGPGFQSSWTLPRGVKRKAEDEAKRRDFPLAVKNGRTIAAVQLGPRKTFKVHVNG